MTLTIRDRANTITSFLSSSIYLILTSDSVVGSSLSELFSLDVLLLFSARFFSCLLTAIALYACFHLDLAKFFLSCSETEAWMLRSTLAPVIHACLRASSQLRRF